MSNEKWIYAGARQYGKIETQVRGMIKRIIELGITHVTFEIKSEETYQLREKVAVLEAERDYLNTHADATEKQICDLVKERDQLRRDNEGLETALTWYASREAWTIDEVEGSYGDYGTRAREAIEKFRNSVKNS